MSTMEGKKVPQVTFRTRQGDKWVDVTSSELFDNKTVIVFSLPGAFTPTCSSSHLPRYNELAPVFKKYGVDDILVVSVNDTFVMNAWKEDEKAENITFVPDGNGEFTEGMGMLVGKEDLGFGKRSWRYPFKVSDADTMLKYIAPQHQIQESVAIFTKPGCPFCAKAKQMLHEKGLNFEEIVLGHDATIVSVRAVSGRATVPQVFIGGKHIGGSDDLEAYFAK